MREANAAWVEVAVAPGTCTYTSSNWAPSSAPNVGTRVRSVTRRYANVPSLRTWNRVRSKDPATKEESVGYW